MPAELVSEIVTAVASALDYAHRQRLLHRDVKPANILIANADDADERRILLSDFGIARTMDEQNALTATNMTVGTVNYAAPEQLMGEPLDGRADEYSLAATAYQLLTGRPMYAASSAAVVISRHLNAAVPRLADTRPELSELDPAFEIALAKDPRNRFPTCGAFAQALAEQLSSDPEQGASLAPTAVAPVAHGESLADNAGRIAPIQSATPLTPGWYPHPNDEAEMLYWDGRDWRTAVSPSAASADRDTNLTTSKQNRLLFIPAIVVPLILVGAGFFLWSLMRHEGTSASNVGTNATATPFLPPPVRSTETPRTVTVPARPSTTTVLVPPPMPTLEPRVAMPTAVGLIQGTCDEGGSCGVKQRTAPFADPPRRVGRFSYLSASSV